MAALNPRSLLVFCLTGWLLNAQADPVAFTSSTFQTNAVAISGSSADVQSDSSAMSALPLVTSASVVGATEFAAANGIAAAGLLTTGAEASSSTGLASAVGTSEFVGSFIGNGQHIFHFDYTSLSFVDTNAFATSNLFVLVVADGLTLLNEVLPTSGLIDRSLFIPYGASSMVDLLLSSEASGGSAQNFASVSFQVAVVPESSSWLLLSLGLPLLVAWPHRRCRPVRFARRTTLHS
jgi:hypothetical protein